MTNLSAKAGVRAATGGAKLARRPVPKARDRHSVPVLPAAEPGQDSDMPFEDSVHNALDPDLRHRMISEAAYYLYVNRNYEDGYDMEDWLTAEQQVDQLSLNPAERIATSMERD